MKVFVSWSGERSQLLAQALHNWLPMVVHFVEPWVSKSDVDAGERWASEVGKELQASNYGIICVTRENLSSPWILFEAGALAKSMDQARVIPLLLDIEFKDISGPLAQFQAKKVEKGGMLEIVTSVNKLDPTQSVPEVRLSRQFELLWPHFETLVAQIPATTGLVKHKRPQHEILEELVSGVRGLDLRFRESIGEEPPFRRRRHRFHPMMVEEISHMLELRRGDPLRILVFASFFREDLPWLYELALDAYRSGPPGSPRVKKATRRFAQAMDMLRRGPILREFSRDKELFMMFRDMEHLLLADLEPEEPAETDEDGDSDDEEKPTS